MEERSYHDWLLNLQAFQVWVSHMSPYLSNLENFSFSVKPINAFLKLSVKFIEKNWTCRKGRSASTRTDKCVFLPWNVWAIAAASAWRSEWWGPSPCQMVLAQDELLSTSGIPLAEAKWCQTNQISMFVEWIDWKFHRLSTYFVFASSVIELLENVLPCFRMLAQLFKATFHLIGCCPFL